MSCWAQASTIHRSLIDLASRHHGETRSAQRLRAHPKGALQTVLDANEMLLVEGKKMIQSPLGDFFTVRDYYISEVIRVRYVLMTHYRKPMDWTRKKAVQAEASLRKWYRSC